MKNIIGLLLKTVVVFRRPKALFYSSKLALLTLTLITLTLLTSPVAANDFPTLDRALFIQECMALKQSQTYETLYACACTLDKIAEEMSYHEYVEADTYVRMRNMRGERGGLFRDGERARTQRQRLMAVKSQAEAVCIVKHIKVSSEVVNSDNKKTNEGEQVVE